MFFLLQDLSEGDEEQGEEIFRNLSSRLLSIANRHEGYQILWTICCDLNDSDLLRSFMVEFRKLFLQLAYWFSSSLIILLNNLLTRSMRAWDQREGSATMFLSNCTIINSIPS